MNRSICPDLNPPNTPPKNTPPKGDYGVWCEAKGHLNNPSWLNSEPMTYEKAIATADEMCRANKQWHYYAKPIGVFNNE